MANPPEPVHLDGRTLEGGGQLVRNALALSALIGQPVSIHHIRANRKGKTGLKGSHLAAVKFLAEVTGSEVTGAEIGSLSVHFFPQKKRVVSDGVDGDESPDYPSVDGGTRSSPGQFVRTPKPIQPEYTIRLSTAGSVFLVFQALYPYLLYAGSFTGWHIKLNLTGGTNVSFSPSYDYIAQVLIPNFARLGLPRLEVQLQKRGWGAGPVDLGTVTLLIEPLELLSAKDEVTVENTDGLDSDTNSFAVPSPRFPSISVDEYQRGQITKIDVTILAPDNPVLEPVRSGKGGNGRQKTRRRPSSSPKRDNSDVQNHDLGPDGTDQPETIRQYIQKETLKQLRKNLKHLPPSAFNLDTNPIHSSRGVSEPTLPIAMHTSEPTFHPSQLYILLVAHTSTGFRLGRDALFGTHKDETVSGRGKQSGGGKSKQTMEDRIRKLVKRCVDELMEELDDSDLGHELGNRGPLDVHMRDQVVVFEALGRVDSGRKRGGKDSRMQKKDEKHWSLHTKTARWVCEEVLGIDW